MNTMNEAIDSLKKRFPYQFERLRAQSEIYPGWLPALTRACELVDQALGVDKRGWHWTQIKEKFGTARFYYRFGDSGQPHLRLELLTDRGTVRLSLPTATQGELDERISYIVAAAEEWTADKCMVCGRPAEVRLYDGWLATLCGEHRRKDAEDARFHLF